MEELISEGLYVERHTIIVNGKEKLLGKIYSSEDYCFYDNEEEFYDADGNLITEISPEQRQHMKTRSLSLIEAKLSNEELAQRFISVICEDKEVV